MNETRTPFENYLADARAEGRPVVLDGAVGTELDNRGARLVSPIWSGLAAVHVPELLLEIHREYATAGAEILTACTFRTTSRTFAKAGFNGDEWRDAAARAVSLARSAAVNGQWVAGSVAPLEDCFIPQRAPRSDEAFGEHLSLCEVLVDAGVDILWLETFGSLGELAAAMNAAQFAGSRFVPFVASVTTSRDGNLISGESLLDAYRLAEARGAAAFCVNCIPVSHVLRALTVLKQHAAVPLGAYANLGFAEPTQDWSGSAHLTPEEYARTVNDWQLDIIGGCCGSTPTHIRALSEL